MITRPLFIGFSVLDGTVERATYGCGPWRLTGWRALHMEFVDRIVHQFNGVARLGFSHTLISHESGVMVALRHVDREHEREQWIVETTAATYQAKLQMHADLTELVVAWQETEDVDAEGVAA